MAERGIERGDDAGRLLARALGPAAPELSCEECFAELDRYVELALAGEDAGQQVPGIEAHLAGCPACAEECRSLRELLDAEDREKLG